MGKSFMGYSRVYLRFRGAENVRGFKEYFEARAKSFSRHGNAAVDDETRSKDYNMDIVVQYAPYQSVSRDREATKQNTWQSSLEMDEEFQAFRDGLLQGEGNDEGVECNQKVRDSGRAVIQSIKSNQEAADGKPKETALMKYVTQLHRKKAQEKSSKRDGKTKGSRRSKSVPDTGKKKVDASVVPKPSKKKQSNQNSGTTKTNDLKGEKSGPKGKKSAVIGSEKSQSKNKERKKEKEKKDSQKRPDSVNSNRDSKAIVVKQRPKNTASVPALKSPSKPPTCRVYKPMEKHLVSTSTVKQTNVHDGNNKEVKFKILTRKEGDGNVEKRTRIPPEPSKASEKSTESIKTNVHPRKGDKPPKDKKKVPGGSEGEAANEGKGRQRRRGPRRQKKSEEK